jgi:hypothetical protein
MADELTLKNVTAILRHSSIAEDRRNEFYAVSQLLAEGELSAAEQKQLGKECVEMLERDRWWRSNGAFNDE